MVVPSALRVLRLKPGRKFCTLKVSTIFENLIEIEKVTLIISFSL